MEADVSDPEFLEEFLEALEWKISKMCGKPTVLKLSAPTSTWELGYGEDGKFVAIASLGWPDEDGISYDAIGTRDSEDIHFVFPPGSFLFLEEKQKKDCSVWNMSEISPEAKQTVLKRLAVKGFSMWPDVSGAIWMDDFGRYDVAPFSEGGIQKLVLERAVAGKEREEKGEERK